MKLRALLLPGLAAGLLAAALARTGAPDTGRYDGEYGLHVAWQDDSLRVGWITKAPGPGRLEVIRGGRAEHTRTTPAAAAHAVVVPMERRGEVVLRYGAAGDPSDIHETRLSLEPPRRPEVAWSGVDSIFVMGDIHGEFDTLTAVLRNASVIDATGRWSGGTAHLVVVGDMMDRGADVNRTLWYLYDLTRQAEQAGGRVHIVLGNHEIMVMLADLRYVHAKEARIAQHHGITYDRMFDPRHSVLGAWLASRPGMLRVDDVLFAHGGVSSDQLGHTIESFDDTLAAFTREDLFYHWADSTATLPAMDSVAFVRRYDFFWGDRSVFWYRGYALSDTLSGELRAVMDRFNAAVHVVGHTPGEAVRQAYGDTLILVNTVPFAAELLLLERTGEGYDRYRYRSAGPPMRLGSAAAARR